MVDECDEDLLSGHPGDSQAVSGFALPDVEGSVCAGREVNGSPGSLAASRVLIARSWADCRLTERTLGGRLSQLVDALGGRRVAG